MADLNAPPRLVLFSGMAIDPRLLTPQKRIRARVETPSWIPARTGEMIPDYARRMAERIDPAGPLYLGGVSFGVAIALEAAKILKPAGVFLIASAYTGQACSLPIRLAGRISPAMPSVLVQLLTKLGVPPMVRVVGRPNRQDRLLLLEVADKGDVELLRWALHALVHWSFNGKLDCPIHQIHGSLDRMIPIENVKPDRVVSNGGHVINVVHADQVNSFIEEKMGLEVETLSS